MINKRKIAVVVTNRASYARIKTALQAIQKHPRLKLQLIVAASALLQKFGSVVDVIVKDGFKVSEQIYSVLEGENVVTMSKTTGLSILELSTAFANLKPDLVLTVADRYETLATAVAASYMNIPVIHVQGGEITGSIDEKVRHAVTKLAIYHFTATQKAKQRVIKMGEFSRNVFMTGCPSIDLALEVIKHQKKYFPVSIMRRGVGATFDPKPGRYLMVLQHPVTTQEKEGFKHIQHTLDVIEGLKLPTFWFWPNVDAGSDLISKGIRMYREQGRLAHVHFLRNLPPEEFLSLAIHSACIIGNSSMAVREASFLGIPAVNIGNRQTGREFGRNVLHVPHDARAIQKAVQRQIKHGPYRRDDLYGRGNAGKKIANILAAILITNEKQLSY
ncbi:MAG: UDP-N-acetylglucosamine 2-epimerase (hydrolyzing) [Candidatus Omnitrophica bacterium]|nr:UDP-N-acetylglucosamine 2-epimerase (hydrolyzing) [Candidatus Omnitrophota bacterium]